MHNLHFLVVNGKTGTDAMSAAESFVQDWGGENNWRTCFAAISAKGKVVVSEEHGLLDEYGSLAKINKAFRALTPRSQYREAFERVKAGEPKDTFDWFMASEFCREQYEVENRPPQFNVLKHSYNDGCYDEFGVTQFNNNPKLPRWVVLMDMHS